MILYFSRTGNSRYVAEKISKLICDKYLSLFERIKNSNYSELYSERPLVIVCPTYAWRIPRILHDWLEKAVFTGTNSVYFVLTYATEIGNAAAYLKILCQKKNWHYKGCAAVKMPSNYIITGDEVKRDDAIKIIADATPGINRIAKQIVSEKDLEKVPVSLTQILSNSLVYSAFYALFAKDRLFYATDDCISCGNCVRNCVCQNIKLIDGKPTWNGNCTHCMACICGCPKNAIEYGRATNGLERYQCPQL